MRFFFQISYNGAAYHGWQNQDNARGVQTMVEEVLSRRFSRETAVTGAGRTDTGVHASNYFAHFDLDQHIDIKELEHEIGSMLPVDIAIKGIWPVRDDAHARFSALSREYVYVISRVRDPFLGPYTYYYHPELSLDDMRSAAAILPGRRDFSSFEKLGSDNINSICDLMEASFTMHGDLIIFRVKANRFLRNMVRAIVGSLLDVGRGKITVSSFEQKVLSLDRSLASSSAPAKGLFLCAVEYPLDIFSVDVPKFRKLPAFLTGIV
jgi:tRNA pseudouridine38-40 synthase